ncbi:MAG: butyrate kinase [Candidatus Neomarinimicrobiota bacterium]|nr:butyrate kinase [Candidatus Neomarinimicrobiota bacterium]RKY54662.1 MAG: butyrate kinase [Candidatus Neomarinimicrobiota bacterium]
MRKEVVFVINPGSTSTKIALFSRDGVEYQETVDHTGTKICEMVSILDQIPLRREIIEKRLKEWLGENKKLVAVIGRGGLLRPIESGVYRVNEKMLDDLRNCRYGVHASNMGALLAEQISKDFGVPAFIADPVTVDEMLPEARISGVPEIKRRSRAHVLNTKACVREEAKRRGKKLEETRFIVAHMGGGITVAPFDGGKMVDCNDALLGMGPFSPERAGALPIAGVLDLAFSGRYTREELEKKFIKNSGLKAYLGTSNVKEVIDRIRKGDKEAELVFNAMIYQVAKEIGAMATVLKGKIDAIIITGGMARSEFVVKKIKERVGFIADVVVYPGENEMKALADNAFRALDEVEIVKEY